MNDNTTFTREEYLERLNEFKKILDKIVEEKGLTYNMFYEEANVDPFYMESFVSGRNPNFPNPSSLKRMAENSNNITTYDELMRVCGHNKILFDKADSKNIRRGDIYWVDFGEDGIGSEVRGKHPALIIQNNRGNISSPTILAVPITSKINKARLSTHVLLTQSCGINKISVAQFEQTRAVDRVRIMSYIGRVSGQEIFNKINKAYRIAGGVWEDKDEVINEMLDTTSKNKPEELHGLKNIFDDIMSKFKNKELLFNKR